jgi:tRNA(Ile)-lysidine synthase
VTFSPASLLDRLGELEAGANKPARYVIALSGGLDSTVLAAALAATRDAHGKTLLAVHVNHQLHTEATAWSDHCGRLAAGLGIEFIAEAVDVDSASGSGLEAAARDARYKALARYVDADDWLLSAHHRDDQAETLLLNLMRGSGPGGLAGIGALNRFGKGWLARPLIDVSRSALEAYATDARLEWVEDPSNEDRRFDRNYLRHEVLPILEGRWPDVTRRLARSADLAGEAAAMLEDLAELDLRAIADRPERIDVDGLLRLPRARQGNVLRYALRRAGLPLPGAARLAAILEHLVPARKDAQPVVAWPGVEVRRYRGKLYILPSPEAVSPTWDGSRLGRAPVDLGHGMGRLSLTSDAPLGLSDAVIAQGLSLHCRRGGEEIKLVSHRHTRKLKKILQENGIVPWMRDRLPLIYSGDQLVAVADLWVAADAASEPGTAIVWHDRPALH